MRAAFAHFDKDSNGQLSPRELRQALTRLGVEATGDEAAAILRKFDADGSKALEIGEFAALAEQLRQLRAFAPAALSEVAREAAAAAPAPRPVRPASAARRRASPPPPGLPLGLGLEAVYDGQVEEEERVGQMLHAQLEAGRAVLARAAAGVAALDEAARALRSQGEEAAQLVAAQPSSSGEARGFRGASRTRTEQQPAVVAAAEAP